MQGKINGLSQGMAKLEVKVETVEITVEKVVVDQTFQDAQNRFVIELAQAQACAAACELLFQARIKALEQKDAAKNDHGLAGDDGDDW